MEGHAERCQGFKSGLYVDLGSTRDAYVQIWEVQVNEIVHKAEDFLSRSRHAVIVWALIECINDEINGALSREKEHLFQALFQRSIAGLSGATIMCRIKPREYAGAKIDCAESCERMERRRLRRFRLSSSRKSK